MASGQQQRSCCDSHSEDGVNELRSELATWAEHLQRRRRTTEAVRERLQQDIRDRRRDMEAAFHWLADVLETQRTQQLDEIDRLERSCLRLLDRRAAELRATRDAIVARLACGEWGDELDLLRLRDAAAAALDAGQPGGDAEELVTGTAEQLRLRQHRWQTEWDSWLKTMPGGILKQPQPQLLQPPQQGNANAILNRSSRRNSSAASSSSSSADPDYYSVPACNPPDVRTSTAIARHRPPASLSTDRPMALTQPQDVPAAEEDFQQDLAPRYWSPGAAVTTNTKSSSSSSSSSRRRANTVESQQYQQQQHQQQQQQQQYQLQHQQHQPQQYQLQQQQQQQQNPLYQSQQMRTTGCPVSIVFAGPPENLVYVAEEFEDDRPNQVNVYSAQGRLIGPFSFNLPDSRYVNPYRMAWCPQSQRLLLLSYESRQFTRPILVDRRGRPSEPFTSATRSLNLAGLEPLDIATADPPGLAFLCCPGHGIAMLDLMGRHSGCQQLSIGAPVAAAWSGTTQQLAVLHSESQPAFRLSLLALMEGHSLRVASTCQMDFESIDPPLVLWDGPRVLVVKVTDENSGCLDIYAIESGCQPIVEAARLLWQGGVSRNPIHCCLSMHEGQRHLCVCDRNHPAVLLCLI